MVENKVMKNTQEQISFNESKFKELVLYISNKCERDYDFGAIKLNKILFYSDFLAYSLLGEPITGAEYIALEHGPAPKMLAPIRDQMKQEDEIAIRKLERFGKTQIRVVPLRNPDLSKFEAREIALVDEVIDVFCGANAREISDYSHLERGWQVAGHKETIPYQAAFLSSDSATPSDIKRASELSLEQKW
ncbi:MAG: Panacea domain-containing protein [Dehalococcoidales bacterium]